jgi:superfamily II DNA/RNA helicase
LLAHLIKNSATPVQSMVLFTSRKSEVNGIVRALSKLGYEARGISSDLDQDDREVVLRDFKNKAFPILVATDVLSRGIDIDNLTHVVNYDIPRDAEDYVHRIGRTARAATTGTAITFISDQDQNRIVSIEKLIEREVEKRSITEELGMGKSPVFDPRRFSGLRGKPGFDRGKGRGKGRDGQQRSDTGASTAERPQRDNRRPRPESAKPVADASVTVSSPTEGRVQPVVDGSASDKPKRRKKRRRGPKGEKREDGAAGSRESQSSAPMPVGE